MIKQISLIFLIAGWSGCASADPAPIPGAGTPTYDVATASGISQVWTQTKALWQTAKDQLAQLDKMQTTLIEAKEGVDNLMSIDLQKWAKDLTPGNFMNSKNKIGALRAEMSNFEGKLSTDSNFVTYNIQSIKNLQTLEFLQQQSAKNLDKSAGKTSAGMDAKITSQNTSTMAALAAAEEARRQMEEHAKAEDAQARKDAFDQSGNFYKAIGKGGM